MHLALATVLPAARAAFDEGRLGTAPCYGAPCALGVVYRPPLGLDEMPIRKLADLGHVTSDDVDALADLQLTHDRWATGQAPKAAFLATFTSLEARLS